jgi:hypothetical protein
MIGGEDVSVRMVELVRHVDYLENISSFLGLESED